MLPLNIIRNGVSIGVITFDLSDHERSMSSHSDFERLIISRKESDLGHMLVLNINRKPYMGSPMAISHLTLSDLEGQYQGHSHFIWRDSSVGVAG